MRAPLTAVASAALVIVPVTTPVPMLKLRPLLAVPPTVTVTGPVVAPAGTSTVILVLVQLVGTAGTPLKETVLTV